MFARDFDAATFRKGFDRNLENGAVHIRLAVRQAKKYVLDVNASKQLSDLGDPKHWDDMIGLRRMARSPYEKIWVEFDNRARRGRLIEINNLHALPKFVPSNEVIPRMAWLIERHPDQPSSHRATMILNISDDSFDIALNSMEAKSDLKFKHKLEGLTAIQPMPMSFAWDTDDLPNKYGKSMIASANSASVRAGDNSSIVIRADIPEILSGRVGNNDEFIGVTKGYGRPAHVGSFYRGLATEFAGELRYIMAFVAALSVSQLVDTNNQSIQPSQRHASGQTMPSYTFTEVRITVPKKRRLAKYIAQHEPGASGIKMRHHDVADHWRVYEHGAGPFCTEGHLWEPGAVDTKQHCKNCTAWRTRVHLPEGRGDPTLGRIDHSFRVTA